MTLEQQTTEALWRDGGLLDEIAIERHAQDAKWGEQNPPDGTFRAFERRADMARQECEERFASGCGTWRDILLEEVYEALAESNPAKLRKELVQIAAVAVAWMEAIDRRVDSGA